MSARTNFDAMKSSDKLRRVGFFLCCGGILGPVGMMYEMKRYMVDHVPMSSCWPWVWLLPMSLPLVAGWLFQHSAKLAKEGK